MNGAGYFTTMVRIILPMRKSPASSRSFDLSSWPIERVYHFNDDAYRSNGARTPPVACLN